VETLASSLGVDNSGFSTAVRRGKNLKELFVAECRKASCWVLKEQTQSCMGCVVCCFGAGPVVGYTGQFSGVGDHGVMGFLSVV
jgi:hypothetical protein